MWLTGLKAPTNSTNHGHNSPDITPVWLTGLKALTKLIKDLTALI